MPVVTALYIYPVKGCRGVRVESAEVARRGFSRDRRYMIVDADGRFVTQREMPRLALVKAALDEPDKSIRLEAPGLGAVDLPLEHETGARRVIQVWDHHGEAVPHREGSAWICRLLGPNHALVYMPESEIRLVNPDHARPGEILNFADAYPVLLISEASLADLNGRLADPITMDRFRPNIVVGGTTAFAEDGWTTMTISGVGFRGAKRCDRCVVTTVDPETGERGHEPLRTLATYRKEDGKVWFGMNLIHDGPGTLVVGDEVLVGPVVDD